MDIHDSTFIKSSTSLSQCPEPSLPEYAFIGRSNVGKSSLINMLTDRNNLAKISSNPGKTQHINHYLINKLKNPWYLVDLPGYGFAKAPQSERKKWMGFIRQYLTQRDNLMCVFLLVDSRHEAQKIDLEFMAWLGEVGIPFVMVFTKQDKLSKPAFEKIRASFVQKMSEVWEELPPMYFTSSEKKLGRDEVLDLIAETNTQFGILD